MADVLSPARVKVHIDMLAPGKASGNSGLPAEAFAAIADLAAEALSVLMALELGVVPNTWKCARIHPVPKKGDLTNIENHRPISLTEVMRKVFESLLLPILKETLEPLSVDNKGD